MMSEDTELTDIGKIVLLVGPGVVLARQLPLVYRFCHRWCGLIHDFSRISLIFYEP